MSEQICKICRRKFSTAYSGAVCLSAQTPKSKFRAINAIERNHEMSCADCKHSEVPKVLCTHLVEGEIVCKMGCVGCEVNMSGANICKFYENELKPFG